MKPLDGRTDWLPGRSERADSSRVRYSRVSLFRPARGCSCDGSAKDELFRKTSTPCADDGSNGVWCGSGKDVGVCEELCAEGGCDEDLRPVNASQIDDMANPLSITALGRNPEGRSAPG